ncbi:MAG TPA: hypothetical protein VFC98_00730, partial [Clostridia bacterium]|nr:hypothetical protein [Clostridia bacterium]
VAIKKTWSPPTVIGYEIKTSRQDFLKDQKYPIYMENCNIFYFVAPKDVIKKGELPEGAGHMIYNPETNKVRTVRKAPYRDIPINPDVLLHIMFWKFDRYWGHRTKAEILADYNATKTLAGLGKEISHKMSCLEGQLQRRQSDLEHAQERCDRYIDELHEMREMTGLKVKGLTELDMWSLKRNIEHLHKIVEKME